eukprot:TRINITY_DN23748_c0_g1_i1.p1 TRINITY_DN23748_c0_g1~~TRINITY_DN23748_c0_g1_i1.p1  ORF type:complete len:322 (-),score=27.94 TRINITY_DN23748_c0_g1_i1:8-973(-)
MRFWSSQAPRILSEASNESARTMWVTTVVLMLGAMTLVTPRIWDFTSALSAFALLPLSVAVCPSAGNSEFGWLNLATQHAIVFARLWTVDPGEGTAIHNVVPLVVLQLMWLEASVQEFRVLMLNHAIINLAVFCFCEHFRFCPVLSAGMMLLFWYRRSHLPSKSSCTPQHEVVGLVSSRCAELIELVLLSGDELCRENTVMLREALEFLDKHDRCDLEACPYTTLEAGTPSSTRSEFAVGVGGTDSEGKGACKGTPSRLRAEVAQARVERERHRLGLEMLVGACLLYTSDAADEEDSVVLGGSALTYNKHTSHFCFMSSLI